METTLALLVALSIGMYAQLVIAFAMLSGGKVNWKQALIAFFVWPVFRPLKFIEFILCLPYILLCGLGDEPAQKPSKNVKREVS